MRYLSICSGIEAASVAWHPLGWEPVAFAENEAFPCAVLKHHYPNVPNFGDVNRWKDWPHAAFDVLVGGTPCQSFSVAGLRRGMADPRGNLALVYLAIADRYRPEWIVWENVPGVLSSNGGRDFAAFIGGLEQLGYHAAWRVLDAQYCRVDGFARAVPQRRRRVFVVGCLGNWQRPAAVLFEREGMQGHPAPRRQAGERAAPTIGDCSNGGGANGPGRSADSADSLIAHSLKADGFDASEDGTGRGTPLVPIPFDQRQISHPANFSKPQPGDPCHPLTAQGHEPCIAFSAKDDGGDAEHDLSPTLRAGGAYDANAGVMPAIAFDPTAGRDMRAYQDGSTTGLKVGIGLPGADMHDLRSAPQGAGLLRQALPEVQEIRRSVRGKDQPEHPAWAVRRLTPKECERLQGFPDGYTAVPYRGKPAADGPRYKALGNSMAVNCMRWLGRRIEMVAAT